MKTYAKHYKEQVRQILAQAEQKKLSREQIARRLDSVIEALCMEIERATMGVPDVEADRETVAEMTIEPEMREMVRHRLAPADADAAPEHEAWQLRRAGDFPNDYVVFVGETLIGHSRERRAAYELYSKAFALPSRQYHPVVVPPEPERHEHAIGVLRGRSLVGPHIERRASGARAEAQLLKATDGTPSDKGAQ